MKLINKILKSKQHEGIRFSYKKSDLNLLVVKFDGNCYAGSRGNGQGKFIYDNLNKLLQKLTLNEFSGIIVDFTQLDYSFGNYIFDTISLIHKLDLPKAIAISEKSKNLIDNRQNLYFNGIENAIKFLTTEK